MFLLGLGHILTHYSTALNDARSAYSISRSFTSKNLSRRAAGSQSYRFGCNIVHLLRELKSYRKLSLSAFNHNLKSAVRHSVHFNGRYKVSLIFVDLFHLREYFFIDLIAVLPGLEHNE